MNYWQGMMNAPIVNGWKCETCGFDAGWLIWGVVNGECRCENCHHVYTMRQDKTILTTPVSLLKEDYKAAAKLGWQERHTPMDHWKEDFWDKMKAKVKEKP